MPDNTQSAVSTAAGNTAAQTQPASGQANSLPPSGRSISDEDYQRFTRYEQQVKGFAPYQERIARMGIRSPEDFDRLTLAEIKAEEKQQAAAQPEQHKPEDVRKLVSAELARERHAESRKSEPQLIEKLAKELAGEDADEFDMEDTRRVVASYLQELRSDEKFEHNYYPPDHPLSGEAFAPLGEKHLEKARGWFTERKTKREAARMQQTAKDANRPARQTRPSPAGPSGGQGKPNDKSRSAREHVDELVDSVLGGR